MIVQIVLKGLFLYFIFIIFRSLFRGASQVQQMKEHLKNAQNGGFQGPRPGQEGSKKSAKQEDVVEAEFRHL